MSHNRYNRTHSYSTSDTYGYSGDYPSNIADEDDIELDDDEFLSDGYEDDLVHGSSNRNGSEYDSSQYIRRAHHNRLEQKRRAFIRDSYTDLKDVMPEFKDKKLSRANILINIRRKVDDNRKLLFDLKRQYEMRKADNDREEREVINMERQLSAVDNNGNYLVDVQHSTPPLANIGVNLVSGIHRPIVNRPTQQSHQSSFISTANTNESPYSDENSPENSNRLENGNQVNNSTGNSSSADTPSICSLTDSPINSGTSSLSSSNAPTLTAAHQSANSRTCSEDNSNSSTAPDETLVAADQVDGKQRPDVIPVVKTSPSLTASSHLAPIATSPDGPSPLSIKQDCVTDKSFSVSQNEKVDNQKDAPVVDTDGVADDGESLTDVKKAVTRPAMITRRMRSCSMSTSSPEDESVSPKMQSKASPGTACKRSFMVTTPASQASPQTTKRICVTAIGTGSNPVRLSSISPNVSNCSIKKSVSNSPTSKNT